MSVKKVALWLGPVLSGGMLLLPHTVDDLSWRVLAVGLWMLVWWLSETVNLAVTALLPLVLFPILGVMPIEDVAVNYANPLVYLFFGGFILALGIEKWHLHQRIALNIIRLTGTSTLRIFLGFMLSTAFISMWISNTATTVMMLPIALSVIKITSPDKKSKIATLMLIGLAWSASIGGLATLIGTPPNLVLAGFMKTEFNREIFFSEWMLFGLPTSIVLLFAAYFLLIKFIPKAEQNASTFEAQELIRTELLKLGKLQGPELRVLLVFIGTALAWMFRQQLVQLTGIEAISDTTIALAAAILLFVLPSGSPEKKRLLQWRDTEKLSWGILVLFGGGFALAGGIQQSTWVLRIGNGITEMHFENVLYLVAIITVMAIFITEIVSNLALVTALLPLVAAIATGANTDVFNLALPLTLGASCAFMLPMATPPNAIVYSSGRITILQMAKYGFYMNLVSVAVVFLVSWLLMNF